MSCDPSARLGQEERGGVAASGTVRYGRDKTLLRHMLWWQWGFRCYWCMRPKDFTDTQIDHIVPKSVGQSKLDELLKAFALPAGYDLDDPRNLAPICADCNGPNGKGSRDLAQSPAVGGKLERAEKMRPEVIRQVLAFRSNSKLGQSLLRINEADLGDAESRRLFEELAPGIVQRLALLGEEKVDFLTSRTESIEVGDDVPLEVDVSVNTRGRTALTILEEVCGCDVGETLAEPVASLLRQVRARVQDEFESIQGPAGPTNSGPPVEGFTRVDFDSVDFARAGENVKFTFGGYFELSLFASLVQNSWDGSELVDLQGFATATGRFSFDSEWNSSIEPGDLAFVETSIESLDTDVWVDS